MKKTISKILVAVFAMSGVLNAADSLWTEDFAAAKKEAAEKGKDLLLDFTGSDWCGWCIKLDNEVFSKDHFKTEAVKDFVLVTLDFPQDESKLSEETKKQNEALAARFEIEGYPTIILAGADGEPYAATGYQEGGPEVYVKHLTELKNTAGQAKKQLADARKETDKARQAKLLDEIFSKINPESADKYFSNVPDEIIALDTDNALKLRNKYLLPKELNKLGEFIDDPNTFDTKADEVAKNLKLEGDDLKLITELKLEIKIRAEISKLSEFQDDTTKLIAGIDAIIEKLKLEGSHKQQMIYQKVMIYLQLEDDLDTAMSEIDKAIAVEPEGEIASQLKELKTAILEEKTRRAEEAKEQEAEKPADEIQIKVD